MTSEKRRLEQKRKKEEDIAVCYVCNTGNFADRSEEHAIVFCDRCCVAVHTSCYNAEEASCCGYWGWGGRKF